MRTSPKLVLRVTFIPGTYRQTVCIYDSLTDEGTIQLVYGSVSSRIDYCNSLLYGIPEYAIKKLQSVHNCPCRHAFDKVQQHKVDGEEIALAALKYRIIFKV